MKIKVKYHIFHFIAQDLDPTYKESSHVEKYIILGLLVGPNREEVSETKERHLSS